MLGPKFSVSFFVYQMFLSCQGSISKRFFEVSGNTDYTEPETILEASDSGAEAIFSLKIHARRLTAGTREYTPGRGKSSSKPSFSGSRLIFGGVSLRES